ncbi:hypothetical protein YTPLAS18_30930 [Nitrospira sp.]|nr:hypothetical protein YTPLAS18_30930 [Nitrospira sp.]
MSNFFIASPPWFLCTEMNLRRSLLGSNASCEASQKTTIITIEFISVGLLPPSFLSLYPE